MQAKEKESERISAKQHLRASLYILTSLLSESTHISIAKESLSSFLYNDSDHSGIIFCEFCHCVKPSLRIARILQESPHLPLNLIGLLPL